MTGTYNLQELTKPMTPRENMFERIVATNRKYTDLFVLTVAMEGDDPVIQAYYEGNPSEDGNNPHSLIIGAQILNNLKRAFGGDVSHDEESAGSNTSH